MPRSLVAPGPQLAFTSAVIDLREDNRVLAEGFQSGLCRETLAASFSKDVWCQSENWSNHLLENLPRLPCWK
ncbi:hypothetical protein CEXT_242841 [Caerostris extrusa]|uniref:Uncharacterized protein n=1 Tax=Caerostris extrusa TaxID=172846 RepID=A0AAV4NU49_CAEEX|nr:hypothetical protein CEXT_242841 [Caerostris extrusa]